MGFTIPNTATATYPEQAGVDSGDFAILAAGQSGTIVASGCAVTAPGGAMSVAVAAGYVMIEAKNYISVTAVSLSIGASHASLGRWDLIVVDLSGTASVITGTAASTPVYPSWNTSTQIVLAAVFVQATASTIASGNIVDKRVIRAGVPGVEIDTGIRAANFDIQAVGTTPTEVEGLFVTVPPQTRRYRITCRLRIRFVSGTAAAAAFQQANLQLQDTTNSNAIVDDIEVSYTQVSAASKAPFMTAVLDMTFDPNATLKTYKVYAFLNAASPASWTSTQIMAGDLPTAGEFFTPVSITVVSL